MSELDRQLLRILKRAGVPEPGRLPNPEQWGDLLERLSRAFADAEQDRYILERTLSAMSRELEELTEQRTRFLLNTSYQLRNPLTVLLSAIHWRLGTGKASATEWPEFMEALSISGRRVLRHLGTLHDFAQIDLGYLQLRPRRGSPGKVIKDLLKAVSPLIEKKRILVKLRGVEELPEMMIDPGKLETVLGYLFTNSLNASPDEGELEVTAIIDSSDVLIEFKDSRPVLDEAAIRAMFARYSENIEDVDWNGVSNEENLALAAELAALHGGTLTAQALPESRMAFRFRFPFVAAEASDLSATRSTLGLTSKFNLESQMMVAGDARALNEELELANVAVEMVRNRNRSAILYVEADAQVRESVRRILASTYDVFFAREGSTVLALVERFNPDLVISETLLIGKSGFDVCADLKKSSRLKMIPFIFLSGDSALTSKLRGLELGADDYLLKPFLEAELLARIHSILHLRSEQRAIRDSLEQAFKIQKALLPDSPQIFQSFEFEAFYQPLEELSGDFFDLAPGKDWTYFYLADVTGHGLPAAQVTYLLKEIFQSESLADDPELPELLGRISKRYALSDTGLDIAILLVRLNPAGKILQFIRAGAPGPIHLEHNRATFLNPLSGPPLSREPGSAEKYQVSDVVLHDKSMLYFFSDGLTEFGTDQRRIAPREVLKTLGKLQGADWAAELTRRLSEINGAPETDDDLTVVRIKMKS